MTDAQDSRNDPWNSLSRYELVAKRYQILEFLGSGGMGEVYEAEDLELGEHIALKIIRPQKIKDGRALALFKQEIQLARKITHPNVCRIFDVGYHQGHAEMPRQMMFLTMELLRGKTLAQQIGDFGRFSTIEALPLVEQIASGLQAAHNLGIIHLDLTTSNIILVGCGAGTRAVITDFGLASSAHSIQVREAPEAGRILGTPEFIAPEQLNGGGIGAATDIYAFGVVIYNMVTGQLPFTAESRSCAAWKRLESPPVLPTQYVPDLHSSWNATILKCLELLPEKRFIHPREVVHALLGGTEVSTSASKQLTYRPPRLPLKRLLFPLGLTLSVLVAALFLLRGFRKRTDAGNAPPSQEHLAVVPFTVIDKNSGSQAFADGLAETLAAKLSQLTLNHSFQIVPISELRAKKVVSVEDAREQFGVNLVVTGSLQSSGDLVRVTSVLIDAKTKRQLGGDSVDLPRSDPFALEDRVVSNVVALLGIKPTVSEQGTLISHGTVRPQAYDYYLRGRGYLLEYEKPENIESAILVLNRALGADPNYAGAYAALGEAYWHKYDFSHDRSWAGKALEACEHSAKLQSNLGDAHTCLGTVFEGTGKFENAVEEFKLAQSFDAADDTAYIGLARAYQSLGRFKDAEETYKHAISLRPQYWAGYNRLGAFYYSRAHYSDAAAMFTQVIALAPDNVRAYANLCGTYLADGRYGDAIPVCKQGIAIRPSADVYSNLASSYFHLRQFSDAAHFYEEAVKLSQQDYLMWGNLADAQYRMSDGKSLAAPSYREAIVLGERDLKVNPEDANLLSNLADYYSVLGEKHKALSYLQRALALAPNDARIKLTAAEVYNQLGDYETTLKWLEGAVASGYSRALLRDTPVLDNLRTNLRFQKLLAGS